VQHERIIAEARVQQRFFDGLEALEIKMLFALELIGAVAVADGDGERIHPGLFHERDRLVRVGVAAAFGVTAAFLAIVVLRANQHAEFAFHDTIVLVGVVHNLPANLHVFIERLVRSIDHHTGETFIDTFLAKLEGIAVVQVNGDGNVGKAHGCLDEFLKINRVGVLAGAFGNLEHYRRLLFFARLDYRLEQFHIVHVESPQGVFALERLGEQFSCVCQWHNFSNDPAFFRESSGAC
jgi:hypothetical protein